jgi:hypothetical protein
MKTFTKIIGAALTGALIAISLTGCTVDEDVKSGYIFRFKVDNDTNLNGGTPSTIKRLEFINGDRQNDYLLYELSQSLPPERRSAEHRVSGFTVKDELDAARRKCGVKVTFEDGATVFGWSAFGHGNKILVSVYYDRYEGVYALSFSDGNW